MYVKLYGDVFIPPPPPPILYITNLQHFQVDGIFFFKLDTVVTSNFRFYRKLHVKFSPVDLRFFFRSLHLSHHKLQHKINTYETFCPKCYERPLQGLTVERPLTISLFLDMYKGEIMILKYIVSTTPIIIAAMKSDKVTIILINIDNRYNVVQEVGYLILANY